MSEEAPGGCLFCAVAAGRLRAHTVFEDDGLMAFLDITPIRDGHVLIIPKRHVAYFDDIPTDLAGRILGLGQRIARAQKKLHAVERVAFFFSGTDIDHAHAHVVPMVEKTDIIPRTYIAETELTFRPPPRAPEERLTRAAANLMRALEGGES